MEVIIVFINQLIKSVQSWLLASIWTLFHLKLTKKQWDIHKSLNRSQTKAKTKKYVEKYRKKYMGKWEIEIGLLKLKYLANQSPHLIQTYFIV